MISPHFLQHNYNKFYDNNFLMSGMLCWGAGAGAPSKLKGFDLFARMPFYTSLPACHMKVNVAQTTN
jgi:hypothetical protein